MTPDVVVDVGNTRIKWGRCSSGKVATVAALAPDDPAAWEEQSRAWDLPWLSRWVVTGVHPARRDMLAEWLRQRGDEVRVIDAARELPLRILVDHPETVGVDRLLNAVAANSRRLPNTAAIIVDAGSAVTVDLLDGAGAFRGGAILPGLRLMAQALHDHTALLPLIDLQRPRPPLPGTSTPAAMAAGIFWAWFGGIHYLIHEYGIAWKGGSVFLTGGDAALLEEMFGKGGNWPEMTLEGIRLAAEALP